MILLAFIGFFDSFFPQEKNEAAGDRTQDPQIKSLLLYQLSYGLRKGQHHPTRVSRETHYSTILANSGKRQSAVGQTVGQSVHGEITYKPGYDLFVITFAFARAMPSARLWYAVHALMRGPLIG